MLIMNFSIIIKNNNLTGELERNKLNYLPLPKPVAPPLVSADTNCPIAEAPP